MKATHDSAFSSLTCALTSSGILILELRDSCMTVHSPHLLVHPLAEAMIAAKQQKPDRSRLITYLATSSTCNGKELAGILLWLTSLRLGCVRIQLPCALKGLDFLVRPWEAAKLTVISLGIQLPCTLKALQLPCNLKAAARLT
eukprot:4444866-Lingulodinium_polyedra.AAC.1